MSEPQKPASPPAIEMNDVTVAAMRNPHAFALEQVNWSVAVGDYWVIAGLHGSGKTDLLMTAAGLTPPKHGEYRLLGETMPIFDETRLSHRLRLGLVFDGGQLFNQLTVAENVALPLRYHRDLTADEAGEAVRALLELMELTPWAHSPPSALSRNWRKRAGLARALALRPEILLLDNPLGGQDPRHANWWLNFLSELSGGHSVMNGRPVTLVVTADHLRPWQNRARQFAVVRDKHFLPLGALTTLSGDTEPLVKELLAEAAANV